MKFLSSQRLFFYLLLALLIQGCSATNQLYLDSLKLAFFPTTPSLTLADIQSSDVDFLKVVYGERQPSFLALAYIENKQHKWVSADHVVLTIDHNKLIKTSGFDTDLQYTSTLEHNPLRNAASLVTENWQYNIDIENHSYGVPITSTWHLSPQKTVTFFDASITVIPVIETITIIKKEPYWTHEDSWANTYWLEVDSKQVIYSEQRATPEDDPMRMTYVSRIARLIDVSARLD